MYVFSDARGIESPGSGHADCEPPETKPTESNALNLSLS